MFIHELAVTSPRLQNILIRARQQRKSLCASMIASTILDTTFPFNLLCTIFFCWTYLKNSLHHNSSIFLRFIPVHRIPLSFLHWFRTFIQLSVCLRSSFLLFTIVCQQQQQQQQWWTQYRKASDKKRIANWFWSLYLINVQSGWMVGNNEMKLAFFFSLTKGNYLNLLNSSSRTAKFIHNG